MMTGALLVGCYQNDTVADGTWDPVPQMTQAIEFIETRGGNCKDAVWGMWPSGPLMSLLFVEVEV